MSDTRQTADGAVASKLMELAARINGEHELRPLSEAVLDGILELLGAQRGFLVLGTPGEFRVEASRKLDGARLLSAGRHVSSGVVRRALESGEPVLSADAQADERFSGRQSVKEMRLRSVMAVPLRGDGRVLGVVYVDDPSISFFDEGHVALCRSFGVLAGIAVIKARLFDTLEHNRRRIEDLNRRLEDRIEAQTDEIRDMRLALGERPGFAGVVGTSPAIRDALDRLARVVDRSLPVLLLGETGTGKGLLARAIHQESNRRDGPFVPQSCAALPADLLEAEVFGHEKGAFTGADRRRAGLFERANGGTLFLDEVGEMSLDLQAKLLRVLEAGSLRRIGGSAEVPVDVRVVAATHRDLAGMVRSGNFREDLLFRLNVFPVEVPPLRQRTADIPLLARAMLDEIDPKRGMRLTKGAVEKLVSHPWPGNVRELRNVLQRSALLSRGRMLRSTDLHFGDGPEPAHDGGVRETFDTRRARLFEYLRKSGSITNGEYCTLCGVSGSTAFRDLTSLVRDGDLRQQGARKGRQYFPTDRLLREGP